MDEKKYMLNIHTAALTVPADHAEKLLALLDGEAALLYLYILRSGGALDAERAAADLKRTPAAIQVAARALDRAGLFAGREAPLPPPEELPEYTVQDIVSRSEGDPTFKALIAEAQRVMGHAISGADLKTLFGIYDRLGMSGDVIMLMINHVAAVLRRRYGEGRLPSMHAIKKEAFYWAKREIFTSEQAESYMAETERREQEEAKVRHLLQISDRRPTTTERGYIDKWLSMGYGCDTLALAYDRTVVKTGRLTWAYMDKIVCSWAEQGLHTVEEVEKGDARPAPRRRNPPRGRAEPTARGDDADRLGQMLNVKE